MKRRLKRILIITSAVSGCLLILYVAAYLWAPRYRDNSFPRSERSNAFQYAQYRFYRPAEIVEAKIDWLLMSESERAALIYVNLYFVPFDSELREYWRPGELKEHLISEGIDFPPETGAYFSKTTSDMVFVNTRKNQELFREYLIAKIALEANKLE